MTKGEYRVGIAFNPSADGTVGRIKLLAAEFIDLIEDVDAHEQDIDTLNGLIRTEEIFRLKSLAQTAVEEAAMWAVKAATKPDRT